MDAINPLIISNLLTTENSLLNLGQTLTIQSFKTNDDLITTARNTSIVFNPLENDEGLSWLRSYTSPKNGTITRGGNNSLTYIPNMGFMGVENLVYKGQLDQLIAKGNITINVVDSERLPIEINKSPIAKDDLFNTTNDRSINFNPLSNDTDPENKPLTISNITTPLNGSLIKNGNEYIFAPNNNFVGREYIDYEVSDGINTSIAKVIIEVTQSTIEPTPILPPSIPEKPLLNLGRKEFNLNTGYGLINANELVNIALGNSSLFDNVPNYEGVNGNYLNLINVPEVWIKGYTGKGVTVAVIDQAINIQHTDLKNNIWVNKNEIADDGLDNDSNGFVDDLNGWNFRTNNNNLITNGGHGTHVMGLVSAENNSIGNTGVAFNSSLMPIEGLITWDTVEKSIYYAVNNGANIINLSLGGGQVNSIRTALQYAKNKGIVVVASAGNDSSESPIYPAAFAKEGLAIAVGAYNENFSNKAGNDNNMLYVTAGGEGISTVGFDDFGNKRGTSMSSPYVAGVVALMLEANPNLTPAQVYNIFTQKYV
jgi:subtilisin family serine protease